MLKIKRRDFIKGSAALLGAAGLGGSPVLNTLTQAIAAPADNGGESPTVEWKPSTCEGCTTWCSVEIGIQTDPITSVRRAVGVRGNQLSGTHNGFVCPRGHLALQELYDPDRIKVPMKRTNPNKGKGVDPGFVPITWDEAITIVATKLMEIRGTDAATSKSHALTVIRGRYTEVNGVLYDSFPSVFGTPNKISHSSICAEAEKFGYLHTLGLFGYPDYDIDNTDYLMLWGVDPTSSNRMVSGAIHKMGDVLASKKVVAIDPRLNSTASKAHRWLPVKPGTDGALALAMAHWILVQGAWNKSFVGLDDTVFVAGVNAVPGVTPEKGTVGLVKWWDTELKGRTPEWAADITGIDAATIKAVAEEFAAAAPKAISWLGPGPAMQTRGGYGAMAIAALNGLVGSADHVGGVIPAVPSFATGYTVKSLPSVSASYKDAISAYPAATINGQLRRVDRVSNTGPAVPLDYPAMSTSLGGVTPTNRVADSINSEVPYKTEMVIGYWQNFAHSAPGADRWVEAFSKVFFVQLGTSPCETTMLADVVLPANHHMFESLAYMNQRARKYNVLTLNQPVVDKLWDTKEAETEFVWLLANKMNTMGFPLLRNYVRDAGFNDPVTGVAATAFANEAEFHEAVVKVRTVGNGPDQATRAAEWNRLRSEGIRQATYAGTWFDIDGRGTNWRRATGELGAGSTFGTPSLKFEFCNEAGSGRLKSLLGTHATNHSKSLAEVLAACDYPETAAGVSLHGDAYAYMPHWESPGHAGSSADFPYTFIDYKSRLNREGRSQNAPWYMEFKAADPGDDRWDDVLKMNPLDLEALGLRDGQNVRVTSPSSSDGIVCRVKGWEGVRPGTVTKSYGQGHWAYGRVASALFGRVERGGNNNIILPAAHERLSGSGVRNASTRVKIVPA